MEIQNYKTFYKPQIFEFEQGFNLLLGPNNAGKTSILEALSLDPSMNSPHRSVRSIPTYGGKPAGKSQVCCSIESNFSELVNAMSGPVFLPISLNVNNSSNTKICMELIDENSPLSLKLTFGAGHQECFFSDESGSIEGDCKNTQSNVLQCYYIQAEARSSSEISHTVSDPSGTFSNLYGAYQTLIYKFNAHRRPTARCGFTQNRPKLDPDAISLAYCINHLQTNDAYGHQILCKWVNRIFPSIKWVQSTSLINEFEIRCLPEEPSARRDDLATSMLSMGTGLGNVLAILYVVLTSRTPQLIAIDEPNAFLHPKALRELLGILESEGKQHQFILTAHSADVLTSISPKTISVLRFDGVATTVTSVSSHAIHEIKASLADLGIRVTDLHAKDRVLWVEGQTEELVIPELLRWACPEAAAGTAVLRVERTGTFSKKAVEPHEVASLYERLSMSSALVPPMVTILLNGELVSHEKRQKAENSSNGKLRYLPRRMLENYLLDIDAISAVLKENGENFDSQIICDHLQNAGFADHADINTIDAAAILAKTFSSISEARIEFRKTRDVQTMVSFLIEENPEFLHPLRIFLRDLFGLCK